MIFSNNFKIILKHGLDFIKSRGWRTDFKFMKTNCTLNFIENLKLQLSLINQLL